MFCHQIFIFFSVFLIAENGFAEDTKPTEWIGKSCCDLAQNPLCRSTCLGIKDNVDLQALRQFCRPSHEPQFTSCLESRQEAEKCCSSVFNSTCRSICKELFQTPSKQSTIKLYSSKGCFHQIPKCLKNYAYINEKEANNTEYPIHHLYCCEKAQDAVCKETCKKLLDDYSRTTDEIHDILDSLEAACGKPIQPQMPMWSCFMQPTSHSSDSKSLNQIPLDVAKLSCCNKAASAKCQKLCFLAFQSDWSLSVNDLETECLSSNLEGELRRCLDDAADSCEMGCDGLSYCANFNSKPTNLYRSCSKSADEAAKWEAENWSHGGVIRGLGILVRISPTCPEETLRAASCLLQLRPCEFQLHESRLCQADCLEIMTSCVDWSDPRNINFFNSNHSATSVCSNLAPAKPEDPCVSLKHFVKTSSPSSTDLTIYKNSIPELEKEITTPCRMGGTSPCPKGFICVRNNGQTTGHSCVKACTLGSMSKQAVPVGSWIQLPGREQKSCNRICQCTSKGFEKCRTLMCFNLNVCFVHDRIITNRSYFYLDCNYCHCYDSEVTCSRRSCGELRAASLPCDCPAHYVPVCSRMGVTFASACLAKCAGLSTTDIEFGSCSSKNFCARQENPCKKNSCVPKPRVCLTSIYKPCPQFECVNTANCQSSGNERPACDTLNRQHPSLCSLLKSGAKLAYRGHCLQNCSVRGPVCGINGEVYSSECAAWADYTAVDYFGPCIAVGLVGEEAKPRCGEIVSCPVLASPNCVGVTPPGACCPVCAGAARLYYSRKQLERIYHIMDDQSDKDVVTLQAMIEALNRQVQVSQCNLRGMLTPEGDIFIINQAITRTPTQLQLQACIAEIEKIVTRISQKSPTIFTQVPLSSLTGADIAHSYIFSCASSLSSIGLVLFFGAVTRFVV